jgi:mitochondrial fission protein ELM1
LKDPRTGPKTADLVWVPEHDPLRGPNVLVTLTSPHTIRPRRLAALREALPTDVAALPAPRVTVLLGGPSGRNRFSDANVADLQEKLRRLGPAVGSFLLTPSRRTPADLLAAVAAALAAFPHLTWDGEAENPYHAWLAAADAIVVTGDSVNMVGEAACTGRPVLVHRPDALSPKITRFLDRMEKTGAVAPFDGTLPARPFDPQDATDRIADVLVDRYMEHRARQTPS